MNYLHPQPTLEHLAVRLNSILLPDDARPLMVFASLRASYAIVLAQKDAEESMVAVSVDVYDKSWVTQLV